MLAAARDFQAASSDTRCDLPATTPPSSGPLMPCPGDVSHTSRRLSRAHDPTFLARWRACRGSSDDMLPAASSSASWKLCRRGIARFGQPRRQRRQLWRARAACSSRTARDPDTDTLLLGLGIASTTPSERQLGSVPAPVTGSFRVRSRMAEGATKRDHWELQLFNRSEVEGGRSPPLHPSPGATIPPFHPTTPLFLHIFSPRHHRPPFGRPELPPWCGHRRLAATRPLPRAWQSRCT